MKTSLKIDLPLHIYKLNAEISHHIKLTKWRLSVAESQTAIGSGARLGSGACAAPSAYQACAGFHRGPGRLEPRRLIHISKHIGGTNINHARVNGIVTLLVI